MTGTKIMIGLSSAGVIASATTADLIGEAETISKIGLTAFMALCIIVLLYAISKLCKFIVSILIPLKEALLKFSETAEHQSKILVEVKDTVKECQKNGG